MTLLAEEHVDHDGFTSNPGCVRRAGRERVDTPLNPNPGIVSDIRFVEQDGKCPRPRFEHEVVVQDRIDHPSSVICILLWQKVFRGEPLQNGATRISGKIHAVNHVVCGLSRTNGCNARRAYDDANCEQKLAWHVTSPD